MSKVSRIDIDCPECGVESTYDIYNSVNVTLDPALKSKILDGLLFDMICPKCAQHFGIDSDLLYHDMGKRLCVWLKIPDDSGIPVLEPGTDGLAQLIGDYTTRVVTSHNELVERIRLIEDGHDDVTVEIVKLFLSIRSGFDLMDMLYYDHTAKKLLGNKNIVFVRVLSDNSQELHPVDKVQAYESVASFADKVSKKLAAQWGPWMWVTQKTVLSAMSDLGLMRRVDKG